MTVSGRGFLRTAGLSCRFADSPLIAVAAFVSSTSIRCTSPARESGTAAVEVSANGVDFTASGVSFRYEVHSSVDGIRPDHGPVDGGTVVVVSDSGFQQSADLRCRFLIHGSEVITIPATFLSSSAVQCRAPTSPGLAQGIAQVHITSNLADHTSTFANFSFVEMSKVGRIRRRRRRTHATPHAQPLLLTVRFV